MTKNDLMNSTNLVTVAESLWLLNLSAIAVEVKKDGTFVFQKDWQKFCDNPLNRDQQKAARQKFLEGCNAIFLACGRVFDGKRLVCIDVDDDRLVPLARTIFGPIVCARFGSKGIGIFVFVDASDDFFKKKKVIKLSNGELGIELLTRGGGTFIPPSRHRKINKTYKWLVNDLASTFVNLPTKTREQWELLNIVVNSPEALVLLNGEATHDMMRDLCAKVVKHSQDDDHLIEVVQSVFVPDYDGINNSDQEIARTLKSAREKGFDRPSTSLPPETVRRLEELNERDCVVKVGGKTLVLEKAYNYEFERFEYVFQSATDFKSYHLDDLVEVSAGEGGSVLKPIGHVWINWQKRSKALAVVLLPNREPGLIPVDGGNIYNLWTGFGVEPAPGKWPRIEYHLKEVICSGDEDHYSYLIRWLANCVQNPERQGEIAVVFKGGRGTGKGTVGRMLARLFGQHYFHAVSSGQIAGRFNAHLRDTVVLFGDEAFFAGDKKNEGVLKAIITEDMLAIEAKFVDVALVKNRLHIVMATNEDWAVPAGADERRFFVLQISEIHKQDIAYFGKLNEAITGDELSALLHSLLELDLSNFDIRSVPQTDALNYQKERSLNSVEDWLLKILMDGRQLETLEWSDWAETRLLYDDYVSYTKLKNGYPVPYNSFSKRVQAIVGAQRVKRTQSMTGARVGGLAFDSLAACQERFDQYLGYDNDWPDEDLEKSELKF